MEKVETGLWSGYDWGTGLCSKDYATMVFLRGTWWFWDAESCMIYIRIMEILVLAVTFAHNYLNGSLCTSILGIQLATSLSSNVKKIASANARKAPQTY